VLSSRRGGTKSTHHPKPTLRPAYSSKVLLRRPKAARFECATSFTVRRPERAQVLNEVWISIGAPKYITSLRVRTADGLAVPRGARGSNCSDDALDTHGVTRHGDGSLDKVYTYSVDPSRINGVANDS
jgi:hypothetical protein